MLVNMCKIEKSRAQHYPLLEIKLLLSSCVTQPSNSYLLLIRHRGVVLLFYISFGVVTSQSTSKIPQGEVEFEIML